MRKLTVIILVLGVILFLQSCATSENKLSEPEGVLLGQSELEKLHSTKISYVLNINRAPVEIKETNYPDGKYSYNWDSHGEEGEGFGTYRIINGQKCVSDTKINNGEERCWNVYQINDSKAYIERTDGSDFGYITQLQKL